MANTLTQATTVCIAAGTVSAPGLYLSTDTNTGIYQSADNELALTVNGTQRSKWTSAGLTVTGDVAADTVTIGGGFGSSGVSIDAAGVITTNGFLRVNNAIFSQTPGYNLEFDHNLYYSGGFKYYGNGSALRVQFGESNINSDFIIGTCPQNAGGAGAAATITERFRVSTAGLLTVATATISTTLTASGALAHTGSTAGFFNTAAISKPTVTGSRASNAALASLCTALANLGLITNSTS